MPDPPDTTPNFRRLFVAALWMFPLAAAAGVLFRWKMLGGNPVGLAVGDIRHAHSHLMLMGWATPALMALMGDRLVDDRHRRGATAIAATGWSSLVLALASFVPFLLWGYDSISVGTADLPVAAILSGLAIFAWYGFGAAYLYATFDRSRTPVLRLWDLAVGALAISSIGAWGVAGLMMAGVDSPLWETATIHFFVELFGLGWLLVGTLGALRLDVDRPDSTLERVGRLLIGAGVAFVFLVGLPRSHTPEWWPWIGSLAAGVVAVGLAVVGRRMMTDLQGWPRRAIWLLGATVAMLAALAIPPVAEWGLNAGLRILFLHVAFAGFVTLGLVAAAHHRWGPASVGDPGLWLGVVAVLLGTMLPATGLWPAGVSGRPALYVVFVGAGCASVTATAACLLAVFRSYRRRR